jgi:hypothetical protein
MKEFAVPFVLRFMAWLYLRNDADCVVPSKDSSSSEKTHHDSEQHSDLDFLDSDSLSIKLLIIFSDAGEEFLNLFDSSSSGADKASGYIDIRKYQGRVGLPLCSC